MPTILFVEDTEEMQKMYSFGLQQEGFEVTVTPTAGEALSRIGGGPYDQGEKFDIVLVDLMLSGMSGLDFLIAANVKGMSPQTKIVILTNLDNPGVKKRVESIGIDAYLTKSEFEPKKLADFLKRMLAET